MRTALRHILTIAGTLLLLLGVPSFYYARTGLLFNNAVDTVSGATQNMPEQPSGTFLILLNAARHPETESEWTDFFLEKGGSVIMEDLSCLVAVGDETGMELAERYQARLAENQMQIRIEDGVLLASKAEQGLYDMILLSHEMAEAYGYRVENLQTDTYWIVVGEGTA